MMEMQKMIKPGVKTTEFWLVILHNTAALIGAVANVLEPRTAAYLMTASTIIYSLTRFFAKQ